MSLNTIERLEALANGISNGDYDSTGGTPGPDCPDVVALREAIADIRRLERLLVTCHTILANDQGFVCIDEEARYPFIESEPMSNFKHWPDERTAVDHMGERTPEGQAFYDSLKDL